MQLGHHWSGHSTVSHCRRNADALIKRDPKLLFSRNSVEIHHRMMYFVCMRDNYMWRKRKYHRVKGQSSREYQPHTAIVLAGFLTTVAWVGWRVHILRLYVISFIVYDPIWINSNVWGRFCKHGQQNQYWNWLMVWALPMYKIIGCNYKYTYRYEHGFVVLLFCCDYDYYNDVIMGTNGLKSPASRLFTQPFIQAQIKENIKAPRHRSLCGECTGDRWIPRKKGQ